MATTLGALEEVFSPGLTLTVAGREYTVPLPSAELGLWCQHMTQLVGMAQAESDPAQVRAAVERIAAQQPPGGEDVPFEQLMLGAAYDQMIADQVPHPYVQFCAITAYWWIVAGEDAAAKFWASGGRPEAAGPANRKERRAAKTTSTAAATTTRKAASGSGTSTRKKSANSSAARPSRGSKS